MPSVSKCFKVQNHLALETLHQFFGVISRVESKGKNVFKNRSQKGETGAFKSLTVIII